MIIIKCDNALTLFKFGERKWMQKLLDGEVSFSCIGNFIMQAKNTGNDIQGDDLEGVFAKLKPNDERISELRAKYGEDLEEISKDEFILFRRKSSKKRPIFSIYGLKANDLINENIETIKQPGKQKLQHVFDRRMFSGFSQFADKDSTITEDNQLVIVVFSPKDFVEHVKEAVRYLPFDRCIRRGNYPVFSAEKMEFEMKPINYDYFKKESFILPVTDKYEELFYKFPKYEYQHEARICCHNVSFDNISDRFTLYLQKFDKREAFALDRDFYLKYSTDIKER